MNGSVMLFYTVELVAALKVQSVVLFRRRPIAGVP